MAAGWSTTHAHCKHVRCQEKNLCDASEKLDKKNRGKGQRLDTNDQYAVASEKINLDKVTPLHTCHPPQPLDHRPAARQ